MTPLEQADSLDSDFGVGRYYKTLIRDIYFVEHGKRTVSGTVSQDDLDYWREVAEILKPRWYQDHSYQPVEKGTSTDE